MPQGAPVRPYYPEEIPPPATPGQDDELDYADAGSLVRRRLIEVAIFLVIGVPLVFLAGTAEDQDPWGLATIAVLMSGVLALMEHPSLGAALRSDSTDRSLWAAMMVSTGVTAVGGLVFLLIMRLITDTSTMEESAEALTRVDGWLALLLWQACDVLLGYLAGLPAALAGLATTTGGSGRYGALAIPAVIGIVVLPLVVLLVPGLLAWPGVGLAAVMAAGLAWLLRRVVAGSRGAARSDADPQT